MSTIYCIETTAEGYVAAIYPAVGEQVRISRPIPLPCLAARHLHLWVKSRDEQLTVDELVQLAQNAKCHPHIFLHKEVESAEAHFHFVYINTRHPDSADWQRIVDASRLAAGIARAALDRVPPPAQP